jgi:hypothetical protein
MREKMREMSGQPAQPAYTAPVAVSPPKSAPNPAPSATPPAPKAPEFHAPANTAATAPATQPAKAVLNQPAAADPQAQKAAQDAMRAHMEADKKQMASAAQSQNSQHLNEPKPGMTPGTVHSLQRPDGPPLPISQDKQRRLSDLLQKYKADQLTPEQYHQERAKILAE